MWITEGNFHWFMMFQELYKQENNMNQAMKMKEFFFPTWII